ncbi:MAG: NCS2 family permease [Limnochordia bacterium]|jgi:AGZA family xanthine/uracil permease-like MFS transporter
MSQQATPGANDSFLERRFKLKENKTNVRTEVAAGITTFMTMAYIIFVNPGIVQATGMPFEAVMYATVASTVLATLLMAFLANYPIALAPGMGLNAYFTYTIVLGMGVPWQTALGAVFISGVVFILLTLTRVREAIIDAVPASLKGAIAAGIGLFIAFIGLKNGGVIVGNPATFVALGSLTEAAPLLTLIGVIITGILMSLRVKGAILWGIIAAAILGVPLGVVQLPTGIFQMPHLSVWQPILFKLDIGGALSLGLLDIIFAFLFVDMFDTVGTLIGVAKQANFLDKNGRLPRAREAMLADAIGTVGGSFFGTPTVTSYVESAAGVAAGGRTGLVGLVVSACFLLSLFFTPLVKAIGDAGSVTAPALVIVGSLMIKAALDVKWNDASEAIPAFLAMIAMPLTYSIANGIALAFISYPLIKLCSGKSREVHPGMYILALLFILRYAYLG